MQKNICAHLVKNVKKMGKYISNKIFPKEIFIKHETTKIPFKLIALTTLFIGVLWLEKFLASLYPFFLQLCKDKINNKQILLGILFLYLYFSTSIFHSFGEISEFFINRAINKFYIPYETNLKNTILFRTRDKVLGHNLENPIASMTTYDIRYYTRYISACFEFKKKFFTDLFSFISTVYILIGFIAISKIEIKNITLFFLILIVVSILSALITIKKIAISKDFSKKQEELLQKSRSVDRDIMEVPPFNKKHEDYLLKHSLNNANAHCDLTEDNSKKNTVLRVINVITDIIGTISIITIKIAEVGFSNIAVTDVVSVITLISIYNQLMRNILSIIRFFEEYKTGIVKIQLLKEPFSKIIDVYDEEMKTYNSSEFGVLEKLIVPPFSVQYQNKKAGTPYTLKNLKEFSLFPGEVILITGKTGSGKTTMINLATSNTRKFNTVSFIHRKKKEGKIASIMFNAKSSLGSDYVLPELVLDDNYDKEKLLRILMGLNLYQEIYEKNTNVFEYLATTKSFDYSNGQRQRLLLARLLYNLDDTLQIIALDEATNALNDEIALKVLLFIKDFCEGKNVMILIASHQKEVVLKVANRHFKIEKNLYNDFYEIIEESLKN